MKAIGFWLLVGGVAAAPAVAQTSAGPAPSTPAPQKPSSASSAPPASSPPPGGFPAAADDPAKKAIDGASFGAPAPKDGVDPIILRAEVMLDRRHFSPGVIDGKVGSNFEHSLEAFQKAKGLKVSKALDKPTWDALASNDGRSAVLEHVLSADEVAGPFFPDLPSDYAKLAAMKTIGYRSVSQKLGAQFHMSEALLASLNPGVDLGKAGARILVADTAGTPIHGKLSRIVVDKKNSIVLGFGRKNDVLIALPATIGSRELPSPSGTYKVKGVAWNPTYYYDPKNFVQGDNKSKLRLPSGPNNPVGSVFIALTKPTYGLHGTPDPSAIDKTASHGCVRMTNWDAAELAHLVRPGIEVEFVGPKHE